MTEPNGSAPSTEPDIVHQGLTAFAALGVAVLLITIAGGVGVAIGMGGGTHQMMFGGSGQGAVGSAQTPGTPPATSASFDLDGMPAMMVTHYEYARANAPVYEQIPCFCGCQQMLAHRNLEDCFVTPDGAWESHASGCQVCIDESQSVMRMMGRGMSSGAMHDRIVAEFGGPMMST